MTPGAVASWLRAVKAVRKPANDHLLPLNGTAAGRGAGGRGSAGRREVGRGSAGRREGGRGRGQQGAGGRGRDQQGACWCQYIRAVQ